MSGNATPAPVPLEAENPFVLRVNFSRHISDTDATAVIANGELGFLHSFTTGSTVDGPGVRLVAWTAGCMWRCRYCHNPDTWSLKNGMPVTIQRAAEELRKYRYGLQVMQGGLTVTGGEPLLQLPFVMKLFREAKGMGIHTAIETNGYLGRKLTNDDLEAIDLVMLGIKTWDPQRHQELTGKEIWPTLDFARRLAAQNRPMWVRFVLVPGLTDDKDDIARIAACAASLGNVERVDVLPFHQMGKFKWKELGLNYTLENVEPPTADAVQQACQLFRSVGLNAT